MTPNDGKSSVFVVLRRHIAYCNFYDEGVVDESVIKLSAKLNACPLTFPCKTPCPSRRQISLFTNKTYLNFEGVIIPSNISEWFRSSNQSIRN